LIDGVVAAVEDLSVEVGLAPDTAVGIGVAGLVDRRGVLRHGPNQPGIVELDVQGELAARLGPRVVVDNDGNCAARAEVRSGVGRGHDDVVLLTFGTGIGAGIVIGGEVVRGAQGLAGEPGHTVVDPNGPPCPCGQRGCWERYASGAGVAHLARDAAEAGRLDAVLARCAGDPGRIRGEDVVLVAREGDEGALAVLASFAWWAALGIANVTAVLDPELVVLGGGLVEAADLWLAKVREDLGQLLVAAAHRRLPEVEVAAHGVEAAARGAADLAADTGGTGSGGDR